MKALVYETLLDLLLLPQLLFHALVEDFRKLRLEPDNLGLQQVLPAFLLPQPRCLEYHGTKDDVRTPEAKERNPRRRDSLTP